MVTEAGTPQPWEAGRVRWLSPGHPGVRARLGAVAADIVRRYPVAGIHLDFIRYPGREVSFDAASLAAFDSMRAFEPGLDFDEARRRFVTAAVAGVRDSLASAVEDAGTSRPLLSAAVWGIYRNTRGWSAVSPGYEDLFQDARAWDRPGLVDALAPMVYWRIRPEYGDRLDFAFLADEHVAGVEGAVEVGIDAHALDGPDLALHVERARLAGASGVAVFSLSALDQHPGRWEALRGGAFRWGARPAGTGPGGAAGLGSAPSALPGAGPP